MSHIARFGLFSALLATLALSSPAGAQRSLLGVTAAVPIMGASVEDSDASFEEGARCLFIGHSFFVPVAAAFGGLAAQNQFPNHQMETVFRGGASGAPGAMWDDAATQAEVEAILSGGDIEIFGLTATGQVNSTFDDYAQWMDLALQYNPNTVFFVGVPWMFGGPQIDTAAFDTLNENWVYTSFEVVAQLRSAYPDSRIEMDGYGKTASVMKAQFEAGHLPDLTELVGFGPQALFVDGFMGHAGPMLLDFCALSWMDVLYGAEVESLSTTPYQSDVASIVESVIEFNAPFQQKTPSGSSLTADAATISVPDGGSQYLSLDAGPGQAGQLYLVLGSTSGTGPTPIPGTTLELPLTADAYLDLTLLVSEVPELQGTLGVLDVNGRAKAQITLPPSGDLALVGLVAHHAYVLFDLNAIHFVSNEVQVVLVP